MQKTIGEYFVRPARRDAQAAAPAPGGAGPAPSARAGAGGALEKVAPSSSSAGAEGHQGWQTPLSASSAAAFAGRSGANKRGGGGLRLIPPPSLPRAQAAAYSAQGQGGAIGLVSGENQGGAMEVDEPPRTPKSQTMMRIDFTVHDKENSPESPSINNQRLASAHPSPSTLLAPTSSCKSLEDHDRPQHGKRSLPPGPLAPGRRAEKKVRQSTSDPAPARPGSSRLPTEVTAGHGAARHGFSMVPCNPNAGKQAALGGMERWERQNARRTIPCSPEYPSWQCQAGEWPQTAREATCTETCRPTRS